MAPLTPPPFGKARFEIVRDAGHLPQIEQPTATFALIDDFVHAPEGRIKP
jgi:pimeloyl-ACP methyl ester carboxylesterase